MTYLICSGGTIRSNQFTLVYNPDGGSKNCQTNKPGKTNGRWYYEVNYVSGEGRDFLAVWRSTKYEHFGVYAFPGDSMSLFTYSWDGNSDTYFSINEKNTSQFDMSISGFTTGKTFGIGFDIDTRMMFFRFGNEVRHFLIKSGGKYFQPYFYEGMSSVYKNDTIKVSFDPKEFVYTIPEGYLPWGYKMKVSSKKVLHNSCYNVFSILFMIMLS